MPPPFPLRTPPTLRGQSLNPYSQLPCKRMVQIQATVLKVAIESNHCEKPDIMLCSCKFSWNLSGSPDGFVL